MEEEEEDWDSVVLEISTMVQNVSDAKDAQTVTSFHTQYFSSITIMIY